MIVLLLGRPKSGKTTLLHEIVKENARQDRLFLIYDILGNFKEYYTFDGKTIKNITRFDNIEYSEFFKLALKIKNCTIFFDEIDLVCSPVSIVPELKYIINYGRNKDVNVSVICAARRPHRVNRDLTFCASSVIMFRMREPSDLRYLGDTVTDDVVPIVKDLKPFQYIKYDLDGEFLPETAPIFNTDNQKKPIEIENKVP